MSEFKIDNAQLDKIVQQFVRAYKQELAAQGKNASGNLANTASAILSVDGADVRVTMNLADYWKYVEYGRKPGKFPPVDKILQWVLVKPVLPRGDSYTSIPTVQQLAFLISRKIATKGIKPTNALAKTVTSFQLKSKIINNIKKQYVDYVRQQIAGKA